ncbi:hypothetical protein [Gilvimarinus agarilyticus]|uniref:hypothetical protein n=1 Tax=Gilvimarinus agarilyticus TaxID=679259 RepID=UPI0005A0658E|nr:hypothetical protein [Gilvimarinus agarilyticus]
MPLLSQFQVLLGALIILFTLFDAFVTILSLRGGGPATSFITRKLWQLMLVYHGVRRSHTMLSASGPLLMIVVVAFWYGMLYLGWFVLFQSVESNIFNSSTLTAASDLDKLYFTGVTLSGLGYGDVTAKHFPWTLLSALAVSTGTLLTSLGLSYIIAVVPVALEKRQLASQINSVVDNRSALIERLEDAPDVEFVWQTLFDIQLSGMKFSTKYGAYPVVAYFHSSQQENAFSVAYLKAADILFYIANHPVKAFRPTPVAVTTLKNLIFAHSENLKHVVAGDATHFDGWPERYQPVSSLSASDSTDFSWDEYKKLRRVLVTACLYDGW